MARKKQKKGMKKRKKRLKKHEQKKHKKSKAEEYMVEIGSMQSDIKTFVDHFRSDVSRKRKAYQSYAKKVRKKKV